MDHVLTKGRVADSARSDHRPSWLDGHYERRRGAIVALALVLLCACARPGPGDQGSPGVDPWYGDDISPHQLAVYERWHETGLVSFADYETAVNDNNACLEDAGFSIEDRQVVEFMGQAHIDVRIRIPDSLVTGTDDTHLADAISSECADRYESLVKLLYAMNPAPQEYLDGLAEERRPYFLECLRSRGYDLPDSSTNDEIQLTLNELFEREPDITDPNCIVVITAG